MKSKKLEKSIKLVMKLLEKEYMSCEMKGKKHWPSMECFSCKTGLVYNFLEDILLNLDDL